MADALKNHWRSSISLRFSLLVLTISAGCALGQAYLFSSAFDRTPGWGAIAFAVIGSAALPALIVYAAAQRLARDIIALRRCVDALAAGDMDRPIDVDCSCELGALADSFRMMANRLNANISRMNKRAHRDPVTGLPNRTALNHVLAISARKRGLPCWGALLFIDLDGFKAINDTLGHECGDALLRQVSLRITKEVFGRDIGEMPSCTTAFGELCEACPNDVILARFVGDEFVALVPKSASPGGVEKIAGDILASLARPFDIGGAAIHVGASIGFARAPADASDPRELLRFADIAMYEAKQRGKNNFVRFDDALRARAVERGEIETELRHGIDAGELTLHFQPKIDAHTLAVAGVEALVRWNHPVRGMVHPGKFIPVAEKAGLMPALGREVLRLALGQCREWLQRGMRIPVAINVSPAQFDEPGFADDLLRSVQRYGVDPALVEIEITETTVMTDFTLAAARLGALREAGFAVSIDDFGVGFSNLSQLAKLPANFIKIDRSLTETIGVDRKAETIVRATIHMAHALGYATIAEGIETIEQAAYLRLAGCDTMQGFLFARPMPAGDFERWMEDRGDSAVAAIQAKIKRAASAA